MSQADDRSFSFRRPGPGFLWASVVALFALVVMPGCSFDDPGGTGPSDAAGGDASDAEQLDGMLDVDDDVVEDGGDDVLDDGMDDADDAAEDGGDTTGDADDSDDASGAGYMEPCTEDADCTSEYCLETESGQLCSMECSDDAECGDEWVCDTPLDGPADSICFPAANQLCATDCTSDADCTGFGSLCVEIGERSVCSRACDRRACPSDYTCTETDSVDGSTAFQCLPNSGFCGDCVDDDGDGFGVGADCVEVDCQDDDDAVYPGATEQCNGVDDNCDGVADEGCTCDYDGESDGVCGTATIADDGTCEEPAAYEVDESTCGDGLDNDCDGVTDENCPCDYAGESDGVCANATRDDSGTCQEPQGYVADEGAGECDGADNDCDGEVDEGCSCTDGDTQGCYSGPPNTAGEGLCQEGQQTCSGGSWGSCQNEVVPTAETCGNNTDEDCDGLTDEGCACDYDGTSEGVCSDGVLDGMGTCDAPGNYEADESSCDGEDNDCDGEVDEGCCNAVDPGSSVVTTSACLTNGTGAQAAIVVELVDTAGDPVTGSTVTMSSSEGALTTVDSSANTYHAVLTPPAASGVTGTTVTVEAQDACSGNTVSLTSVNIAFADPLAGSAGGAGGCQADGNVRVQVVQSEDGSPIQGANVMVGQQEDTSAYESTFGQAGSGANTGTTDAQGYVEFNDFGTVLDSPVTVTAAATGRAYKTMVGVDSSDFILPLEEVNPNPDTGTYSGRFTNIDNGGDVDAGLMLGDVDANALLNFNLGKLLADDECYESGSGWVGDLVLPGNTYIPAQRIGGAFLGTDLDEKTYTSAPLEYGSRKLVGLAGETTTNAAGSGDFVQILQELELQKIGVRTENVSTPSTTGFDLAMDDDLTPNISCDHTGFPQGTDLFCITGGDWDALNDPSTPLGAGRLFVMGIGVISTSTTNNASYTIDGVTTVDDSGDFAGIEYFGASAALYLDPDDAPNTDVENGASIIARRGANQFDASGGTLTFDDYLPIRPLTRSQRNFAAGALTGSGYPTPHYTRTLFQQVITETYDACGTDDATRTSTHTYWTVYGPGSVDAWDLPTPPAGWPRHSNGIYSGMVNPASTSADDVISWLHTTAHEAPNASTFDYDAMRFNTLREAVTHVTLNSADL